MKLAKLILTLTLASVAIFILLPFRYATFTNAECDELPYANNYDCGMNLKIRNWPPVFMLASGENPDAYVFDSNETSGTPRTFLVEDLYRNLLISFGLSFIALFLIHRDRVTKKR